VTLILTVNGPETIWLLADRRLSYPNHPPRDDGRKVMILETTDGVSLLGYAGLGATSLGTEPADWMSNVLRGRNQPLEPLLGVLAAAVEKQLPRHLIRLPVGSAPAHTVVAASFVDGKPSLHTIDLVMEPDRRNYHFRFTRHIVEWKTSSVLKPPRVAIAGSGGLCLQRDTKWKRPLLNIVRASEDGKVSPYAVADHLARINNDVHIGIRDKSVGPSCIVARGAVGVSSTQARRVTVIPRSYPQSPAEMT
jgi:hypothetical protein